MMDLAAMQVLALQAVESQEWGPEYRRICRWYSATFFTPLHVVENDLEEEYVITHYFEHTLKQLYDKGQDPENTAKRDEWVKVRERIISLLDKDKQREIEDKDTEDDLWAEELSRQIRQEEEVKAKKIQSKQEFKEPPNLDDEVEFSLSGE